ncbi:hypothetical protein BX616_000694 [Lobosporangium transversale]|nr:hypothetical protein BX616_000694 [Lobosporangium transversale]
MSNEGEWTTVTSKHSTGHKPQRPFSTAGGSATPLSSKPESLRSAAADKYAGSSSNRTGHHNHHHHSNKKATRKDASSTSTNVATTKANVGGGGNGSSSKQMSRSRSSSISSGSDSSQSDDLASASGSGSNRLPYHITIMIHCPFQSCDMTDPLTDSTSLVLHLKEAHKIVFKNIHHMFIMLDRYLNHWANEIEAKGIENVAAKENEADEFYTIDPLVLASDRVLRDVIQREKLNEILKLQEKERHEDAKLKRKSILFKHMFAEHNFNIGLPDNLVNVNEFLDMLEAKLTSLQCLYCEKTFTSPAVLRKHMRKKKHFKISARNRLYDQFYVINYLEPGKNWENFEHDRYDSDDDRRDDSWADWDDALEEEKTKCLFEDQYFDSAQQAREHMKVAHGFDLEGERRRLGLDFYQTITLINYIRRQTMLGLCFYCLTKDPRNMDNNNQQADLQSEREEDQDSGDWLVKHLQEAGCGSKVPSMDADFWKDAQFLLPMLENDPLLMIFGEEDSEDDIAESNPGVISSEENDSDEGDD